MQWACITEKSEESVSVKSWFLKTIKLSVEFIEEILDRWIIYWIIYRFSSHTHTQTHTLTLCSKKSVNSSCKSVCWIKPKLETWFVNRNSISLNFVCVAFLCATVAWLVWSCCLVRCDSITGRLHRGILTEPRDEELLTVLDTFPVLSDYK